MIEILADRFIYIPIIVLMMTGLYIIIATGNLVKRLVGLSIFQTSIGFLYIALGTVFGGAPPILENYKSYDSGYGDTSGYGETSGYGDTAAAGAGDYAAGAAEQATELAFANPLPHVLILTAIVVGVATLAVGLALVVRIREAYGTIEDDALNAADYTVETGGGA